ncbi:MAG TPA: cytochrome c biogenesis protein CcsA [Flavisolibacter sp.]|jgi:cytochrome c-type biogenesis protein CcmF|nr:cytochrome c biogenesis protein CcsA [Flavisolibacter sp.]
MDFIGEHLAPGRLGHFFLILSFIASLGATVSYFFSVRKTDAGESLGWKKLARLFFIAEAISVVSVFTILFYIIYNHQFEYKYAWQHSSRSLEMKYLLSCFWEGQEGSFLLWSFWHCILGLVFIWREKQWEGPVMAVISFVQVILATMVIGIDIFGWHIGSNPFVLLRNSGVLDNAPAFFNPDGTMVRDYLSLIKDGNDLNPLLQNYWMVIHPPVLFLGFASTLVPFAFAVGGLWTRKFGEWTKAALPWALFSAGVFGLGIMMGAAWAYESLNFGGYWAWDPVENASLVPWLVMVGGVHTLLIYRHTGNALRSTFLFFLLSFILVLYSTYLTRSGDLQDTSVHAFTGEGITKWHLRFLLLVFLLPALTLFFQRYKNIPFIAKEEETSSREFWMFIGSIVLFLSAALISCMTSIPVFNKLLGLFNGKEETIKKIAIGEDAAFAYNRIQIFVAVIIGFLSGFGMYLKYKATGKSFMKSLIWPLVAGFVIGGIILAFGNIDYREQGIAYLGAIWLGIIAAVYSMIANGAYIFSGFKGKLSRSGGSVAHLGFAMMLLGILISASKKEVLSYNTTGISFDFGAESKEKPGENLTLVKNLRTKMGDYYVTYNADSVHPKKSLWYYKLQFEGKDNKEHFVLSPNAFVNYKGNKALMANPDAKHYLTHDIFTYITSLPDPTRKADTTSFKPVEKAIGDTIFYSKGFAVLEDITSTKVIPNVSFGPNDSAAVATVKVFSKTSSIFTVKPALIVMGANSFSQPDTLMQESLILQLQKVEGKKATIGIKESEAVMQYVTLKAYKFPFINLLWLGTLLMVTGFLMSMAWRIRTNRLKAAKN